MHDELRKGAPASRARARPRILLVTPEPVLGVALSQFLAGYFAQVALATSLGTARTMLVGPARYSALVLDSDALAASPGTDPLAALLAGQAALRGRVVVLGDVERDLQHALGLGPIRARQVLSKPVPGSELVRAIDACIGPGLHKARLGARGTRAGALPGRS